MPVHVIYIKINNRYLKMIVTAFDVWDAVVSLEWVDNPPEGSIIVLPEDTPKVLGQ